MSCQCPPFDARRLDGVWTELDPPLESRTCEACGMSASREIVGTRSDRINRLIGLIRECGDRRLVGLTDLLVQEMVSD